MLDNKKMTKQLLETLMSHESSRTVTVKYNRGSNYSNHAFALSIFQIVTVHFFSNYEQVNYRVRFPNFKNLQALTQSH